MATVPNAPSNADDSIMIGLGPILVLLLAAVFVPVRDDVGVTNIALAMALVVVVAATTGRNAGLLTAVTAAVAYNFFHTEPYRSLRIHGGRDVITVVLLAVIGVVVSEITTRQRAASRTSQRHRASELVLESTSELLARPAPVPAVWEAVESSLRQILRIDGCRFEPGAATDRPVISRVGSLQSTSLTFTPDGFELPAAGAAIPVVYASDTLGHIILISGNHAGSSLAERRAAVALADQLAVAIATSQSGVTGTLG